MDKRTFLSVATGRRQTTATASPPSVSLEPYAGSWTEKQARHLLSRTLFGHSYELQNECVSIGMDAMIDRLLVERVNVDQPIYDNYDQDPNVPVGETWVNTPPSQGNNGARRRSHRVWLYRHMNDATDSIHEKMLLFWHEHIPIAALTDGIFEYLYSSVLRKSALGNFRTLLEEVTITPGMLLYLNGRENTRRAPNENYARELMELFTLGRGPAVGAGDYTNYTEEDVFALARALTGWRFNFRDTTLGYGETFFQRTTHDLDEKQLSHRFDNRVIQNSDEEEYKEVIDILLEKEATALNICRRLHIWFIGSNIDDTVEEDIIKPLAQIYIDNNYEIKPVLRALLSSDYFFSGGHEGCMVSSPIDYVFKLSKAFKMNVPTDLIAKYGILGRLMGFVESLDQTLMDIPEVAGWKAYYQEPLFYKTWINSFSLLRRQTLMNALVNSRDDSGVSLLNLLDLLSDMEDKAYDPNLLISELSKVVFPFDISDEQIAFLKTEILRGRTDEQWEIEYTNYLADPNNVDLTRPLENKLRRLVRAICNMPEFHLL